MSASVPRKHKKTKQQRLATTMFKKGVSTSLWSEDDAVNYFNMNKAAVSVLRYDAKDTLPGVEWYVNDKREVLSREV